MFENLNHTLYTFFISMLPIVELRGAIPVGCGFGLPFWENYLVCTIGNLLPVPFILLFIRFILNWMKGAPHLSKIANWVENKAHKHSASIVKYAGWGLFIFVAIPLPGTGCMDRCIDCRHAGYAHAESVSRHRGRSAHRRSDCRRRVLRLSEFPEVHVLMEESA